MSKVLTAAGKTTALDPSEADEDLSSLAGINEAIIAATYNVSIDDQNRTLEISNATGCAVQLPAVSTITAALHTDDYKVCFKNIGAGDVTVGCGGGNTFDDTTVSKTVEQYEYLVLQTDSTGGKWNILDTNINVVNAYNSPDFDVLFDRSSAQRILGFTDGTDNIYFYGENSGTNLDVGLYDTKNTRTVCNYDESANTFNFETPLQYAGSSVARIQQNSDVTVNTGTTVVLDGTVPSWVKRIDVSIFDLEFSTTGVCYLQIGPSTGYTTTGYAGAAQEITSTTSGTSLSTGFAMTTSGVSTTSAHQGHCVLTKSGTSNIWLSSSQIVRNSANVSYSGNSSVTLTGTLSQIRIISGGFDSSGFVTLTYYG